LSATKVLVDTVVELDTVVDGGFVVVVVVVVVGALAPTSTGVLLLVIPLTPS
jgi:hypothetical protein